MAKVRQLPENTSSSSNVVATRSRSIKDGILHLPALPRRSYRLSSSSSVTFTNTDQKRSNIRKFENRFYYGPQDEKRTCILSHGDTFSWTEKSSQSSWIAVDGTKTTCVVSMATRSFSQELEEDEWTTENGGLSYPLLRITMAKALCETIDSSGSLRKFIGQKHETGPIAVVNLAPGTIGDHQETNEYQQALDAIRFLEAKLKHQSALTPPRNFTDCNLCSILPVRT